MDQIALRRKARRKEHRKELSLQLGFVAALLLFLALMLSQILRVEGVDFLNPQIEDVVRNKLGPGIITRTSVSKIRNIDMSNSGFEDIFGIESLWNLRTLNLSHNYISDLSPLSELEHLKELDLSHNNISSLEGIENLKNLEKLNLEANIVKDLGPLKNLPNLKELNLNYNDITSLADVNIGALAGSSLQILRLRDNYKIEDDYTKIIHLSDVNGVQDLQELRRLDLRFNDVQDIRPIGKLMKLEHLDLRENKLGSIRELAGIQSLRKLNLRGNEIIDISPLKDLKNLSYLNLHSNPDIASIAPIQGLVQMDTLIVRNVPIGDDIRYISGMKKLHRINVQNCGITNPQIFIDLLAQGTLQDGRKKNQRAEFNLLENDIQYQNLAQYSQFKDLWDNISLKAPFALPRPENNDLQITLSHPSGFYDEEFELIITCNDPDARILYTLDGSEPDIDNIGGGKPYYVDSYKPHTWKLSNLFGSRLKERRNYTYEYTGPLRIKDRSNEANDLSEIITTYMNKNQTMSIQSKSPPIKDWTAPKTNVPKSFVVRASAIKNGSYSRQCVHSYFITKHEKSDLPVISIVADVKGMFGFNDGIYVPGKSYFEAGGTESLVLPKEEMVRKANYGQTGKYWRREAHVEFIDAATDRTKSLNMVDIQIQGRWSRATPHKGIKVFEKEDETALQNRKASFIMRTGGNTKDYLRDSVCSELIDQMDVDVFPGVPYIQFINGEYFGIITVKDNNFSNLIKSRYGSSCEDIVMLKEPYNFQLGMEKPQMGERHDVMLYNKLHRYFTDARQSSTKFAEVDELVDMNSIIDCQIAFVYLGNTDGFTRNKHFSMWKAKHGNCDKNLGAKWRYYVWDFDFGLERNRLDVNLFPGYHHAVWHTKHYSRMENKKIVDTSIFARLLSLPEYRKLFVERALMHTQTTFNQNRVVSVIDRQYNRIQSELPNHELRWGQAATTLKEVEDMKVFARERPKIFLEQLRKHFPEQF